MFFHLTIFWNKIPKNTVLLKGQLIHLFKLKQEKPKALRAPSTIFFKEDNMNIYITWVGRPSSQNAIVANEGLVRRPMHDILM